MRADRKKKKKNKTAGFSLIEIVVAVALLGIVTVPIMSAMIRTAQINQKARNLQKATDLAQNLMEGIREYTMKEVIDQCIAPGDGFKVIYSSIIDYEPDGYTYLDAGQNFLTQLQDTTDDDPIYGMVETTYTSLGDDEYNFAFCGITYNKTEFDAIVTFTKYEEEDETDPANGQVVSKSQAEVGPYCIYEVEVTIYSALGERFSDSARITSVTGAVQNE